MKTTPWQELTQAQLDWSYLQSNHAPNMAEVSQRCELQSEKNRAWLKEHPALGTEQTFAYDTQAQNTLEWYSPKAREIKDQKEQLAPIVFFVHGGAWKSGHSQAYALPMKWLLERGVHLVIPNFSAVTDCEGDLNVLLSELQKALAFCASHALTQGADPQLVHVLGHSSGAHLAACLKVSDWSAAHLEEPHISSLLLVSGMYDLEAVSHSSRSEYVNFTPETVNAMSPERHLERFLSPKDLKVTLCCGTKESPEFIRQSSSMHEALKSQGVRAEMIWCNGVNHFEILEQLCEVSCEVSQALLMHLNTH